MSLGLGLVVSVLLLIVAWQLEKRHAWRKAAAVAGGLLVIGLVAALTLVKLSDWSRAREVQAEVERVRKGEFREYQGISLGATKNEILYRKGKPTEESASAWVYRGSKNVEVIWTNNATVGAVVCDGPWFKCDEVAGAGIGTSEKALRELLGQPQREAGPEVLARVVDRSAFRKTRPGALDPAGNSTA